MTKNIPLVSVIIPTYNRPDFLVRAVESVQKQNYPKVEVIVIDDASKEKVGKHLEEYPDVKVLINQTNKGGCYSRNRGIQEAKGVYLNFLDDDDILFPEKISKQVACFEASDDIKLGMVTSHNLDGRSGVDRVIENRVKGNVYREMLASYVVSGTQTMLFKAEAVKKINGFDEQIPSSQEYDLLIRLAEHYTVDFVDEILSKQFRSIDQISYNFEKKINGAKYLYKKHNQKFKKEGVLFWIGMRLKLRLILTRYYVGKLFGEKLYRMLLLGKG